MGHVVPKKQKEPSFEETLSELESLVETLEKGELTLDESLQFFERGVELTRSCKQALEAAEQRVQILTDKGVEAELEPFEGDK